MGTRAVGGEEREDERAGRIGNSARRHLEREKSRRKHFGPSRVFPSVTAGLNAPVLGHLCAGVL